VCVFFQGKEATPENLQAFYKEKMVPLVGQINPYDQEKKYSKRPLCVVYYSVDFSFEYRKGILYKMCVPFRWFSVS